MKNIRGYYDRGKVFVNLGCYFPLLFIGQFVHPVGGEVTGWVVILARYAFYFIRKNDNLVKIQVIIYPLSLYYIMI